MHQVKLYVIHTLLAILPNSPSTYSNGKIHIKRTLKQI